LSVHYPFGMHIKGNLAKGFLITLVISLFPLAAVSAPKITPGSSCKVLNQKVVNQSKTYTCIKSGKKLVWNKGVAVKKPTPTPSPSPAPTVTVTASPSPAPTVTVTASPSPAPTVTVTAAPLILSWQYKSEVPLVPGTLVDGSPEVVQDQNLNSSFVVKATRDGVPTEGLEIKWKTSDSTSRIVPFATKTDKSGLARIWYFAGADKTQRIEVDSPGLASNSLSIALEKSSVINKTVGRYVSTYFSAPGYTIPSTSYDAFEIKVVPKSSPMNTYYQLITTWQEGSPGETSFYGGLQQANCNVVAYLYPSQVCEKSRGELVGRLALFSAWDAPTKSGPKSPKVVSLGPNARCVPFTHEGSGQSCSQPLDWKVNEKATWKVEVLGEIIPGYYRVKSSVAIGNSTIYVEVATLDLPDAPNLTTVSPFVEEWGGNESSSCLDVETRELEILSLDFFKNSQIFKPIYGLGLGGLYNDGTTRCQNYSITTTSTGINIKSGGKNHWVDLLPIISLNSSNLPLKLGFVDQSQTLWPWQLIDITPLKT
jgi:hypothetical protein